MICSAFLFSYALENVIYNAFLEQAVMHSVHSRHSVPFFLLPELPVTSTSIWQTSLHLPQNTHLSLSQVALGSEKTAHCFRKTVMGHIIYKASQNAPTSAPATAIYIILLFQPLRTFLQRPRMQGSCQRHYCRIHSLSIFRN